MFRNQFHFYLLALLAVSNNCTANDTQPFVLVPQIGGVIVGKVDGLSFDFVGTLPFPGIQIDTAKNATDIDIDSLRKRAALYDLLETTKDGWITTVLKEGKLIGIARFTGSAVERLPDIVVEENFTAYTAQSISGLVYVGGSVSGRRVPGGVAIAVYQFNARHPRPQWKRIFLEIIELGKSIDAFLQYENLLIAVDNIVVEKYFLVYDISYAKMPRLLGKFGIPFHGVYEHIYKVASNGKYFATLSTTSGRMAWAQHLSIFQLPTLKELTVITNSKTANRWSSYAGLQNDSSVIWESMCFFGDTLVIASNRFGLGLIDFSRMFQNSDLNQDSPPKTAIEILRDFAAREKTMNEIIGSSVAPQYKGKIQYGFPASLTKGKVLNVIPMREINSIAVILSINNRLKSYTIDGRELREILTKK